MEELLEQEKYFRLNGEKEGSTKTLRMIIDNAYSMGDEKLLETVRLMGRKKGQIKEAFREAVIHAYNLILERERVAVTPFSFKEAKEIDLLVAYTSRNTETSQGKEVALEFLKSLLHSVVEGKIYLEKERVLITDTIKQIYIEKGDLTKALESVYNVNIETFSSLSIEDIVLYQMEQMRLAILCCDREKVSALSKRVSQRHLFEVQHLKKVYMNRMIFVYFGEKKYASVSKVFAEMLSADEIAGVSTSNAAEYAIFYGILAIFKEEASSKAQIKRSVKSKLCGESARILGEVFLQERIVFAEALEQFLHDAKIDGTILSHHSQETKQVLLQHNLRVVSLFYSRIKIERIAELFRMPKDEVYSLVTEMIRDKIISGKVDQRTETVAFLKERDTLSEWAAGIDSCLDLIIKITHSIKKYNEAT